MFDVYGELRRVGLTKVSQGGEVDLALYAGKVICKD